MVILDTDHLSIVQQKLHPDYETLTTKLNQLSPAEVAVTIISFQEQVQGWFAYLARAKDATGSLRAYLQMEKVLSYFCNAKILQFDREAQNQFNEFRRQCIRLSTLDLRIASIAITTRSKLLSGNLRDFRKVPQLAVEDWTR